jgi:hypothetical protein
MNKALLALLKAIFDTIVEWLKQQGSIEATDQIKAQTDAQQKKFDQISNSDLSVDDAFGRLHSRANKLRPPAAG